MTEYASNCCQCCGTAFKPPRVKPYGRTVQMMEEYPEIPRLLFVCQTHGQWIKYFDDLFPVYWENNRCELCK